MSIFELIENVYRFGLEYFRKYYGPYRAVVVSNQDPAHQGRIQIACPRARIGTDNLVWVAPMMHGAGAAKGIFWPPDKDDGVWIFFDNGDPTIPLGYVGGWYGGYPLTEVPVQLNPDNSTHTPSKRGFITPGGHQIILDDTSGSETVLIKNSQGMQLSVNKDGIQIGSTSITALYESMLKGETTKLWLESHTHSSVVGPTGPAIEPFPPIGLSSDVKNS